MQKAANTDETGNHNEELGNTFPFNKFLYLSTISNNRMFTIFLKL